MITNRKASFEYHYLQTYTAGIMLTGTEVKSLRDGKGNISDAFCLFQNGELWLKNMHISEFKQGSYNNHDPRRLRKLLLKKNELQKILSKVKEKGITLIPVKVFFSDRGFAKVEIALARGKKQFDKREDLKKKDAQREIARALK
jgi:SsrA-binding protein